MGHFPAGSVGWTPSRIQSKFLVTGLHMVLRENDGTKRQTSLTNQYVNQDAL